MKVNKYLFTFLLHKKLANYLLPNSRGVFLHHAYKEYLTNRKWENNNRKPCFNLMLRKQ